MKEISCYLYFYTFTSMYSCLYRLLLHRQATSIIKINLNLLLLFSYVNLIRQTSCPEGCVSGTIFEVNFPVKYRLWELQTVFDHVTRSDRAEGFPAGHSSNWTNAFQVCLRAVYISPHKTFRRCQTASLHIHQRSSLNLQITNAVLLQNYVALHRIMSIYFAVCRTFIFHFSKHFLFFYFNSSAINFWALAYYSN